MKSSHLYIIISMFLAYIIIISIFVTREMEEIICKDLFVEIESTDGYDFVIEDDIHELVVPWKLMNKKLSQINIDSLETYIRNTDMVQEANVYKNIEGELHISVKSRKPLLRVVGHNGFYIDEHGKYMPLSTRSTSRVFVASGTISQKYARQELYPFVKLLSKDKFWTAYIEQIVVKGNDVTLIPKIGNFKIELGTLVNIQEKMNNLLLFLEQGINKKGWNEYKTLNLKFKDQIVCVKK